MRVLLSSRENKTRKLSLPSFCSLSCRSCHRFPHPYRHEECHEEREQIERAEDRQKTFCHDVSKGSENDKERGLQNQPGAMGFHEFAVRAGFSGLLFFAHVTKFTRSR